MHQRQHFVKFMLGIEQKRKGEMKPTFTIFAYGMFSEGYLHSMRNVPKNSLINGLPPPLASIYGKTSIMA